MESSEGSSAEPSGGSPSTEADASQEVEIMAHFSLSTPIDEVASNEVFGDYGRLIFPVDEGYMSGETLGDLGLVWYNDINPERTVEIVNYLYSMASAGKTVFYDIYTDEEKAADPDKEDTGLFFFRGKPGAKTAVLSAGGGFAYVGAMQDSYPAALKLSQAGYNAFAIIYRPDSELACEDLSRAIAFLFDHQEELEIDMTDYSLWGGSAGARMAAWVGTYGTSAFGERSLPQPAIVVTQYTGLSEVTGQEPPTYANVGTADWIASYQVMQDRIERIKENGTDAQIEVFEGLPHGFGLGEGTAAEGWINHAISFWQAHMTTKEEEVNTDPASSPDTGESTAPDAVRIPQDIAAIPSGYTNASSEPGTLEDLTYDTWESFSYEDHTWKLSKHAVVYLPYGYSPEKKYDVFYLMHGGWSNENGTLGTPGSPSSFKNVLDNAIQNGDIRPLIVVCPTYNNTNENGQDSADFSLALRLTDNYHRELLGDLMPAVESRYSTYAEGVSLEDFASSRDHRGFGGFSMGSVATWHTFQYDLDYFRYFLPMSCGTSLDEEQIFQAAQGRDPSDYFVFIMTGTDDFAYGYDSNRSQRMASSAYFKSVDEDPENGNFAFRVKDGYSHDGRAASEYIYNGMMAFFPSEGQGGGQ